MSERSLEHRAVRVSMVTGVSTILSVTFQLVSVPVCLHYWGQDTYGNWLVLFAAFLLIRSLDAGYVAYVGNRLNLLYHLDSITLRRHLGSATAGILVISTIQLSLAAAVYYSEEVAGILALEHLVDGGGRGQMGLAVLMISWVLTGSYIGIVHRLFIPAGLMFQAAWWGMAFQIANFAAIMMAAISDMDLLQTSLLFALSQSVIYILSAIYIKGKLPQFFPWWKDANVRVGLLDLFHSSPLTASNLIQQTSTNGLLILLAAVAGPAAIPAFTTVRTLTNLWTNVTTVLTAPLLPDIVRFHAQKRTANLARIVEAHWVIVGFVVNMGVLLSYPFVQWFFHYWTGDAITLDNNLLSLLLGSVIVANSGALMAMHLLGINRLRLVLATTVIRAVFGLGLGGFLFGYVGLASFGLGIFVGEIVAVLLTAWVFYRNELLKNGYNESPLGFVPPMISLGSVLFFLANAEFGWTTQSIALSTALCGVLMGTFWGWRQLNCELQHRIISILLGGFR